MSLRGLNARRSGVGRRGRSDGCELSLAEIEDANKLVAGLKGQLISFPRKALAGPSVRTILSTPSESDLAIHSFCFN
jgi:hypothetical protein